MNFSLLPFVLSFHPLANVLTCFPRHTVLVGPQKSSGVPITDSVDPFPNDNGGDGTQNADATARPAHGFGFGCSSTGGAPLGFLSWLGLMMLTRRRQR